MRVLQVEHVPLSQQPDTPSPWFKVTCDVPLREQRDGFDVYTDNGIELDRLISDWGNGCTMDSTHAPGKPGVDQAWLSYPNHQYDGYPPLTAVLLNSGLATMDKPEVRIQRSHEWPGLFLAYRDVPHGAPTLQRVGTVKGVEKLKLLVTDQRMVSNRVPIFPFADMYEPWCLLAVVAQPGADLDTVEGEVARILTL